MFKVETKGLESYFTKSELQNLFGEDIPPISLGEIKLTEKQQSIYDARNEANFHIFSGAVRSGKTYLASLIFINFIIEHHTEQCIYIASGRTSMSIRTNFIQILDQINFTSYKIDLSKNIITLGNSKILLFGSSDTSSYKTIRGLTATGWYANEVTLHDEGFVSEALRRVSTNPKIIVWDCNPTTPNHYIYKNFIANEALGSFMKYSTFTIYDNEENLASGYIEFQKSILSAREQKLFLDGEWVGEGINPFSNLKMINYPMQEFMGNKGMKIAFLDPAIDIHLNNKGSSDSALAIIFESVRNGQIVNICFGYVFKGGYQLHLSKILSIVHDLKIDLFYYENNLVGERVIEMSHEASKYPNMHIESIRNNRPKLARISNLLVPIEKQYLLFCDLGDEEFTHNVKYAELSEKSSVKLDCIDALESGYRIVKFIV